MQAQPRSKLTFQVGQEEIKQARAHFEGCARNYEVEARDVRDVEVAQAVAPFVFKLNNAEGHILAMRSQQQDALDRKGSSDINTRQIEDSAQHQYDSLLEQLNIANQKL